MDQTVPKSAAVDGAGDRGKITEISFDLLCDWDDQPPVYRIYADDDLLTERSYIWRNEQSHVRENVIVSLDPGQHRISIISVYPELGRFWTENISINGTPAPNLEFSVA